MRRRRGSRPSRPYRRHHRASRSAGRTPCGAARGCSRRRRRAPATGNRDRTAGRRCRASGCRCRRTACATRNPGGCGIGGSDAGVATAWLTPLAPATSPARSAGTDRSRSARRTVWPLTECNERLVSNARSTCAALPVAWMSRRSADTSPTEKPCARNHALAVVDLRLRRREACFPLRGVQVVVVRRARGSETDRGEGLGARPVARVEHQLECDFASGSDGADGRRAHGGLRPASVEDDPSRRRGRARRGASRQR